MGACALVNSLKSLDRKQMEVASDHFAERCAAGPKGTLILQDAGCIPVLVDLLALEGLKNTKIVANTLYSINIMCLETEPCLDLSNLPQLPSRLEHLYRADNLLFKGLAASIVCRLFNQLSNTGRETALVSTTRAARRTSSLAAPKDPSDPVPSRDGMTGLLIRLLDSQDMKIVRVRACE